MLNDLSNFRQFAERAMVFLACALVGSCSQVERIPDAAAAACNGPDHGLCAPATPREFRAAWIATVANIDWPSKNTLTVAEQRAEIIAIVNRAADLNLNALILQIRPSADAMYPSSLEPWSEFLTGEQGRAPNPPYDPLQTWIDEAHKRGIELHAWFNPYRARHTMAKTPNAASHVGNRQPRIVKTYGTNQWIDPGEPSAISHTLSVVLDVVRRYDIDAVHMDDYFYPYPVKASDLGKPADNGLTGSTASPNSDREIDFPDEPSWQAYVLAGGTLARADWRRQNVNQLVDQLHRAIRAQKPWVKFGISPFGIGRPDRRPAGVSGFSQYDKLYADVELWLRNGWVDYLVPQLYWAIDAPAQPFATLLDYWHGENVLRRHMFSGLYTSRIDDTPRSWQPSELLSQIALTRSRAASNGHVHYSMKAIMENRKGIADQLQKIYSTPALPPVATWMASTLAAPRVQAIEIGAAIENQRRPIIIKLAADASSERALQVAIWLRYGNQWQFALAATDALGASATAMISNATSAGTLNAVVVAGVDRYAREGARVSRTVLSTNP